MRTNYKIVFMLIAGWSFTTTSCNNNNTRKEAPATPLGNIPLEELSQSTDRFVISSIPVTGVIKKEVAVQVEALGAITYDTRLINTISARMSGRIEKMYVRYRYQHVFKGERIMDVYSPEIQTVQQELLFLLKNDPHNESLILAAQQKLLLSGMSEAQLQQVIKSGKPSRTIAVYSRYNGHLHEAGNTMPGMDDSATKMDVSRSTEELPVKEGMYLQKGQNVFQLFDTGRSWALLSLFPEDQGKIRVGNEVIITPETAPAKRFRARIDFIEPVYRQNNKTLTARVYFDNASMEIPIGSQVRATIFGKAIAGNWLPAEAVLSLGVDRVVFIKASGGFRARKIRTGIDYQNQVQVLSGIRDTDSVAANAQYLTDSESFIKANREP